MRKSALAVVLLTSAGCMVDPIELPPIPDIPIAAATPAEAEYELATQRAKFANVTMRPHVSFLNSEEREVINLLIEAAELMNEIYLRQRYARNPELRQAIVASGFPNKHELLDMFDLHFGVWDSLAENHPFFSTTQWPEGAGFYPEGMTRAELDAYLAVHSNERQAILSPYSVVRRRGGRLLAIPYSEAYREWLEPAACLLEQAAAATSNQSLARFLKLRAQAFRTNDYYDSELAWMDIEGTPIEPVIGPYEVYTDRLMGTKTAFEAFITVKDPEESEALKRYKALLPDMERHLPVPDRYKNFNRPFSSPILVADQVHGGGDNVPGSQTIAFNLPNDERVREVKGAKKVILQNVLAAKYKLILVPMADFVLIPEQARLVSDKYMGRMALFHELSHSIGPGTIEVNGRRTTVGEMLRDQYTAAEEAKADIMGAWNILYMMGRGVLPSAEKEELLATFFVGLLRSMRFGIDQSHGRGAALQYNWIREKGAVEWDSTTQRFRIDYPRMETAIRQLTAALVRLQGDGDYEGVQSLFNRYARLDDSLRTIFAATAHIPTDIRPNYPKRLEQN